MDALFHPMETAVTDGDTALFIQLLNHPEYRSQLSSTMLGHDCLNSAIMLGREKIVQALINLPLSVFNWTRVPLADQGALTYLSRAANFGQDDIIRYIIHTGKVSVTERDQKGRTALHYACKSKCDECADILLLHEVDPNERDFQGRTPLFFAAMEGSYEVIVRLLVVHNIDPDVKDHGGRTPFYWAIFYGHNCCALNLRNSGRVDTSILSRAYRDREAVLEAGLPLAFAKNS
ncbi:hypothetical protein LB507_010937 [Fusarium sp. FIESC RH6]|nr:hypothetical protein LB507_010937 [Fusarium sp. FIESC RH6]